MNRRIAGKYLKVVRNVPKVWGEKEKQQLVVKQLEDYNFEMRSSTPTVYKKIHDDLMEGGDFPLQKFRTDPQYRVEMYIKKIVVPFWIVIFIYFAYLWYYRIPAIKYQYYLKDGFFADEFESDQDAQDEPLNPLTATDKEIQKTYIREKKAQEREAERGMYLKKRLDRHMEVQDIYDQFKELRENNDLSTDDE
eukprot:CAMPEP_0114997428 /NCGR_PEP_ID=MMETSP0216-20121206/14893_1 /TAXON_ID=223996 /ORGANISM="Protocruzia adherens, Strain Boccale" /LENGTH=192 /DNA_ID=CAMNT_0002361807 /DNA_START=88 /DNA_END=666 /DNA_ORIENTATION=+